MKNYKGYESPLECFNLKYSEDEKREIREIGRGKFFKMNPALYGALLRWGQIEYAIPETSRDWRLCDIEKIIESYTKSERKSKVASKMLAEEGVYISPPVITEFWKDDMKFKVRKRGKPKA